MMDDFSKLTEEEEQLYDRQIRLWGMDAQNRLRNAKVLIIGVNGVSCEVIKNLVLTGINTIGLADELNVTEEDIGNNFLVSRSSLGGNRAEAARARTEDLNPRVTVNVYNHLPLEISNACGDNQLSIEAFDIVVCCLSFTPSQRAGDNLWLTVNELCRRHKKSFFAMDSFGWHGVTFIDLGVHHFVKEQHEVQKPGEKSANSATPKLIQQTKTFCSLSDVMEIDWSVRDRLRMLRRMPRLQFLMLAMQQFVCEQRRYGNNAGDDDIVFLGECWRQFADKHGLSHDLVDCDGFRDCLGLGAVPVNAVLGGLVTQEIIKAISGKNEPVGNFVLFNGVSCSADSTFTAPIESATD